MTAAIPLGPLMVGIEGVELTAVERERLQHPLIGGVILFTRNYRDPAQLRALTDSIARVRETRLLVAVDHEGGRVQRFREGFTRIPAMRAFGELRETDRGSAIALAQDAGFVMATELAHHGIDFSLAPVLDVDHGNSSVVGDRSFHSEPDAVAELACALQSGMARGGMPTVGKHFPGHGFAKADSHIETPIDTREFAAIEAQDLVPFARMIAAGMGAVMPAHVIYPAVDNQAAGFSRKWLSDILRGEMGFAGAIISDDLGMAGAASAGSIVDRAQAAVAAGCDLILSCNDPAESEKLLAGLSGDFSAGARRLETLRRTGTGDVEGEQYRQARARVEAFAERAQGAARPATGDIVGSL